jgi:SOS-response transcriptional repressor LexA
MKTVGKFIRAKREEKGFSAREVAKRAGISDAHVLYIENEQRKPTFDVLMKILKALNADVQEFLQETGFLPTSVEPVAARKARPVPVISWVMACKWGSVCDNFRPGDAEGWTESDVKGKNVFALRIKGDSMEPEFVAGDLVIVNPHLETKRGDFVIVKNDDNGEATFKQLRKYGETIVLHPLNSKYEDIELKKGNKYRIVGKVVKKEKRY